jgi:hypothetical protein
MFGYEQDNPGENEDCEYDHLEGIVLLRTDKIKLHHYLQFARLDLRSNIW